MSSLLSSLGIDGLGVEQRLQLLKEIRESLEGDAERLPLTESQRRELARHRAAPDSGPVTPKDATERDRVEALLLDGLDSGPSTPMTPGDWDEIEREGRRLIAEREARRVR